MHFISPSGVGEGGNYWRGGKGTALETVSSLGSGQRRFLIHKSNVEYLLTANYHTALQFIYL